MANYTLFCSALALSWVHMIFLAVLRPPQIPLSLSLVCAVFTSIWNHAVTYPVAKWCDRGMIALAAALNIYYLLFVIPFQLANVILLAITSGAIGAYFSAKHMMKKNDDPVLRQNVSDLFHLVAHVLQTVCNCGILYLASRSGSAP
jgi:hypothetical protein